MFIDGVPIPPQRQTGGSYILKLQEHTLISSLHMRLTYSLINIQIITTQPSLSQTHTHTGKSGFSFVLPVIAQFALKWKNKSVAWIFYFQMHYKYWGLCLVTERTLLLYTSVILVRISLHLLLCIIFKNLISGKTLI